MIAAGKVLSTRIVRTVINGRDTYRMELVCDEHPARRHPIGDGRVSFDLGPSQIAVAVQHGDGTWSRWVDHWPTPSVWTPCDGAARSGDWIVSTAPAHRPASTPMAPISLADATGGARAQPSRPVFGWLSCIVGLLSTARGCTARWPTNY